MQRLDLPEPVPPLAVIADLHMGIGDKADDFRASRAAFWGLLDDLPPAFQIVLAGDVLEGLEQRLDRARDYNRRVLAELRARRAVFLAGNHDLEPQWLLAWERGPVRVEHGHRADPWNKPGVFTGALIAVLNGAAERLGFSPARTWANLLRRRWAERLGLGRFSGDHPARYLPLAREWAKHHGFRLYFFGHTHSAGIYRLRPLAWAVNVGAWVDGRRTVCLAADRVLVLGDYEELGSMLREVGHERPLILP